MGTLIIILAVLFATLFVALPLIEKYSTEKSEEELGQLSRWLTPLIFVLIIASAARFYFA